MGNEINQDQRQDVRFGQKPVWKVRCHFFTNDYLQEVDTRMRSFVAGHSSQMVLAQQLEREQQIDIVVHDGKVTRVLCPLFKDGVCLSDQNKDNPCYLK